MKAVVKISGSVKVALALLMFVGISFSSMAHNEDPKEVKKATVAVNELKPGFATLTWTDYSITGIQIISSNGLTMPIIPVADATSLHLNDLMNGTYEINFMAGDKILVSEKISVNK